MIVSHRAFTDIDAHLDRALSGARSHRMIVGPRRSGRSIELWSYVRQLQEHARAGEFDLTQVDGRSGSPIIIPPPPVGQPDRLRILVIDDLDVLAADIGPQGQRQLWADIEDDKLLLIATSTSFEHFAAPLQERFEVAHIRPLTWQNGREILTALSPTHTALAGALIAPDAHARLATIADIAGDAPQIWTLATRAITAPHPIEFVDELAATMTSMRELVAERLMARSRNERRVIGALVEAGTALSVKEIAERSGIMQRSAARTLGDLRTSEWIYRWQPPIPISQSLDGRTSLHMLASPAVDHALGAPRTDVLATLLAWHTPGPVPPAPGAQDRARELAAALDSLANQDAAAVLALPTALLRLVARGLTSAQLSRGDGHSLTDLRLRARGIQPAG